MPAVIGRPDPAARRADGERDLVLPAAHPGDVTAAAELRGGARLAVVDHGLGLAPERLAEENARLTRRERLDLAPTEVLGLFVVGRLARRHRAASGPPHRHAGRRRHRHRSPSPGAQLVSRPDRRDRAGSRCTVAPTGAPSQPVQGPAAAAPVRARARPEGRASSAAGSHGHGARTTSEPEPPVVDVRGAGPRRAGIPAAGNPWNAFRAAAASPPPRPPDGSRRRRAGAVARCTAAGRGHAGPFAMEQRAPGRDASAVAANGRRPMFAAAAGDAGPEARACWTAFAARRAPGPTALPQQALRHDRWPAPAHAAALPGAFTGTHSISPARSLPPGPPLARDPSSIPTRRWSVVKQFEYGVVRALDEIRSAQ